MRWRARGKAEKGQQTEHSSSSGAGQGAARRRPRGLLRALPQAGPPGTEPAPHCCCSCCCCCGGGWQGAAASSQLCPLLWLHPCAASGCQCKCKSRPAPLQLKPLPRVPCLAMHTQLPCRSTTAGACYCFCAWPLLTAAAIICLLPAAGKCLLRLPNPLLPHCRCWPTLQFAAAAWPVSHAASPARSRPRKLPRQATPSSGRSENSSGKQPSSHASSYKLPPFQRTHAGARSLAPCLPPCPGSHQGVVVLNLLHGRLGGQGELDHGVGVQLGQGRRAAAAAGGRPGGGGRRRAVSTSAPRRK